MRALLLSLILACSSALADDVATVVAIRGDVFADDEYVTQGMLIDEGSAVRAFDKSFVVLQFFDGAKVTVRPNSEIIITDYRVEKANINLVEGGLRIITGAIAKSDPESYTVETKTALMGVRGTEFSLQIVE